MTNQTQQKPSMQVQATNDYLNTMVETLKQQRNAAQDDVARLNATVAGLQGQIRTIWSAVQEAGAEETVKKVIEGIKEPPAEAKANGEAPSFHPAEQPNAVDGEEAPVS